MARGQFVKIQCKADTKYNLSARTDGVVLAPADDNDPRQQWYKDESWASRVKDDAGFPGFALVNRATGTALTHPGGEGVKVNVSAYFGDNEDRSVIWTLSKDVGEGWNCLRPYHNTLVNLSTNHWDKKHPGLSDGTDLVLQKWLKQDNQCWKLIPLLHVPENLDAYHTNLRSSNAVCERPIAHLHRYKIKCRADTDFNLSARSDGIVLAPADDSDSRQQWIKDDWWSSKVVDSAGFPAFALINVATQKALSHAAGEGQQVTLSNYRTTLLDDNVLWTLSQDVGSGWHALRPANNIKLILDAFKAVKKYGGATDGTKAVIFEWNDQENQHWNLIPIN